MLYFIYIIMTLQSLIVWLCHNEKINSSTYDNITSMHISMENIDESFKIVKINVEPGLTKSGLPIKF